MNQHEFRGVLPQRVYAVGTHRSREIDIPSVHGTFEVRVGVAEHLDPDTEISVGLDISLDGGQTWQADGAAGRRGGVGAIDRTTELPMTRMTVGGGLWGSRGRSARVRLSVRGHATTLGPIDLLVSDQTIDPRHPGPA